MVPEAREREPQCSDTCHALASTQLPHSVPWATANHLVKPRSKGGGTDPTSRQRDTHVAIYWGEEAHGLNTARAALSQGPLGPLLLSRATSGLKARATPMGSRRTVSLTSRCCDPPPPHGRGSAPVFSKASVWSSRAAQTCLVGCHQLSRRLWATSVPPREVGDSNLRSHAEQAEGTFLISGAVVKSTRGYAQSRARRRT